MSKKTSKHQGKPNYKKQQRKQAQQSATASTVGPATPDHDQRPASALRPCSDSVPDPSAVVTLAPLAPIIVRSGRPFDFQAGADAARFPPPSTLAGCLRTAWARETGTDFGPALAQRSVTGPLLVRVDDDGKRQQVLVPKPADAHYYGHGDATRCIGAEPKRFEDGCGADLPEGLQPVQLLEQVDGKASSGPRWWAWEDFIAFRRGKSPRYRQLAANGWSPSGGDRRTHVAIDPGTLAADAGRLFQTEGLDLEVDHRWLEEAEPARLRLLARFSEPLAAGLVHLGGERRLTRLHPQAETVWPKPPQTDWFSQMQQQHGLTLTLLTPGLFAAGDRPSWLDEQLQGEPPGAPGVRLQLVAAALERWQPHSGWDLAAQQPRTTRKLVTAGATYWFRLLEAPSDAALEPLWLASLCDDAQDRRDGYGLALPAPWTPTV